MDKEKLINKLIAELQKDNEISDENDYALNYKDEFAKIEWNDVAKQFHKLGNIETYHSLFNSWKNDFLSSLSGLKNLKHLLLEGGNISSSPKQIKEGLNKMSQLETLWFVDTQIENFPETILDKGTEGMVIDFIIIRERKASLPNLKSLGIIGNKFYKQNFHFKLKKECNELKSKIYNLLSTKYESVNKQFVEDIKNIPDNEKKFEYYEKKLNRDFQFIEYNWGLYGGHTNILILKDDFLNNNENINSLSVYVLNKNQQDNHEIFKTFYSLFSELNNELDCFEINEHGNMEVFFYLYENDYRDNIELNKLKNNQKNGKHKYGKYFVNDLLIYLGGEELINEIQSEQSEKDKKLSKKFYDSNHWINRISIENFKLFSKTELTDLGDINIVVGKNGAGKTSLLQAIAASLIPCQSDEINNISNYINIKLNSKPQTSRFAKTHIEWIKYQKAQRFFYDKIETESINGIENELPQSYLVLAYGENLYSKKTPFEDTRIDYQDFLADGFANSYHTKPIFSTSYEKIVNPLDLLNSLSEQNLKEKYKSQKRELNDIAELIREKLNCFLEKSSTPKIQIEKDGVYYKFLDAVKGQYLDYSQISEGYRSYIILLADIVMRIIAARNKLLVNGFTTNDIFNETKGAIIIDEFDKHMHPTWQRTFLKTLREELPKIQFFLSTHNIVSLQSAEGEKVFVISIDEQGEANIEKSTLSIGNTIEDIYRIYFGDKIYSEKSTEIIEQFNKLKRLAIIENDKKYLEQYIKKAENIRKKLNEENKVFSGALEIDIEYLKNFLNENNQ